MAIYFFVLPIWFGVFGLLTVCALFMLRDRAVTEPAQSASDSEPESAPPPQSRRDFTPAMVVATVIAGAAITFSSAAPQRFDRLETRLGPDAADDRACLHR